MKEKVLRIIDDNFYFSGRFNDDIVPVDAFLRQLQMLSLLHRDDKRNIERWTGENKSYNASSSEDVLYKRHLITKINSMTFYEKVDVVLNNYEKIVIDLKNLTNTLNDMKETERASRLQNIYYVLEKYCRYCGAEQPDHGCQCQNDC